jgi:flagellar biosynthetic protein FliO
MMKRILHHFTVAVLCLILSGVIAAAAIAQQNKPASPSQSPANLLSSAQPAQVPAQAEGMAVPDLGFSVLRTVGGLGLVLTLIVGGYFAIRKFAPQYFAKSVSGQNMRVIETLPMGDRRSISLIEVANSRFLVGNTPQQINLILTLPDSLSLVSETEAVPPIPKPAPITESGLQFRKMYDFERGRTAQRSPNPLPDDLRMKMRQLRRALER